MFPSGNLVPAEEDCRQQGITFLPLMAESLGGWHPCAEREVKKLGSVLARHTGQLEGEALPTSGADLASCFNGEMLQYWATGCPTSPKQK